MSRQIKAKPEDLRDAEVKYLKAKNKLEKIDTKHKILELDPDADKEELRQLAINLTLAKKSAENAEAKLKLLQLGAVAAPAKKPKKVEQPPTPSEKPDSITKAFQDLSDELDAIIKKFKEG